MVSTAVKMLAVAGGLIAATQVKIFRSGLTEHISLLHWLRNHTIWADPATYVPRELVLPPEMPELKPAELPDIGEIQEVYYVAQKRFGEERHDLREWITPYAAKVVQYATELYGQNRDTFILNCWEWVCSSFAYPRSDYHEMKAFVAPYRSGAVYRQRDFWHTPVEMIGFYEGAVRKGKMPLGDCEDSTFLLASLLLTYTDGVYANVGSWADIGHAWVTVIRDGQEYILETTYNADGIQRLLATDPWVPADLNTVYMPKYRFDHQTLEVLTV